MFYDALNEFREDLFDANDEIIQLDFSFQLDPNCGKEPIVWEDLSAKAQTKNAKIITTITKSNTNNENANGYVDGEAMERMKDEGQRKSLTQSQKSPRWSPNS